MTSTLDNIASHMLGQMPHWQPIYELTVDGILLNPKINDRLIGISYHDARGLESDELEISLSDHDGALAFPPRGAIITFKMGWQHIGLTDKGSFIVQSVRHSGSPDVMTIKARAADLGGAWTLKKERTFTKEAYGTLGKVLHAIALEHRLGLRISTPFVNEAVEPIIQQNESDISLISKLALDYDAIATIKNGILLFITKGAAATASGSGLPLITIQRSHGDSHDFSVDDADQYTGVTAHWHNKDTAQRKTVTTKKRKPPVNTGEVIEGSKENTKVLRHTYSSKENATRAAVNEWKRLQRSCADFSYTLAYGNPNLICESPAKIIGIKDFIEERNWLITDLNHSLTNSGLTTTMQFESPLLSEFDVIEE